MNGARRRFGAGGWSWSFHLRQAQVFVLDTPARALFQAAFPSLPRLRRRKDDPDGGTVLVVAVADNADRG
jgi:hypothetical protein